jgi:uracil-DNA glycosylase
LPFETHENDKDEAMRNIVSKIRNCDLTCYLHEYEDFPINQKITKEELKKGKPLVDDWRGQEVLFISQAPSRQAWVDHELSSVKNTFLIRNLLPKLYLNDDNALEKWQKSVFWLHTANCYPGRNSRDDGDKIPNRDCADFYFDEVINTMKPKCIILMGLSAAHYFTNIYRLSVDSASEEPLLREILKQQSDYKHPLVVTSSDGKSYYETIVFKHAARNSITSDEKFALNLVIEKLAGKENSKPIAPPVLSIAIKRNKPAKHTWLDEIVSILESLGGDAKYKDIFNEIEKRGNMDLKPSWKGIIMKTIGLHSSDSGSYKQGNPNLFYMIGKGHWGLR